MVSVVVWISGALVIMLTSATFGFDCDGDCCDGYRANPFFVLEFARGDLHARVI